MPGVERSWRGVAHRRVHAAKLEVGDTQVALVLGDVGVRVGHPLLDRECLPARLLGIQQPAGRSERGTQADVSAGELLLKGDDFGMVRDKSFHDPDGLPVRQQRLRGLVGG